MPIQFYLSARSRSQMILIVFALVFAYPLLATTAPPETPFDSKVSAVTVYLQGAQVNRMATITIPSGRQTLVFTDLTTKADPQSIQFSLSQPGVQVLSVSHRINFDEKADEDATDQRLRSSLDSLDSRERYLQTMAAIGKEEEAILQQNRKFGGQQAGLNPEQLEQAVAYHRQRLTDIRLNYLELQDSLSQLAEQRKKLLERLSKRGLDRQQPATGEIVVEVESSSRVTAEVGLSYIVPDASWSPTYDVRVDDIAQPVDLRYRARVSQKSGEDWEQVKITLSTGTPSLSASAPQLPVWRLSNGSRPPVYVPTKKAQVQYGFREVSGVVTEAGSNEALIGASVLVEGTAIGTVTDFNGNFTLQVPVERQKLQISYIGYNTQVVLIKGNRVQDIQLNTDGVELEEVVVTGYSSGAVRSNMQQRRSESRIPPPPPPVQVQVERRATTVAFVIELPYDIPADGRERTVEVRSYSIPATFEHYAVPKLNTDVYLTAALADWEQYDLISGEIQLFFEGTYLGASQLDLDKASDTLVLSLGRDPSVIVSREVDATVGKKGSFFAGKATQQRAYVIDVRNTKDRPIKLLLSDQIPVAANKEIDIDADVPKAADYNEKTGMLEWSLNLVPGESKNMKFGYEVKYPQGYRINLE